MSWGGFCAAWRGASGPALVPGACRGAGWPTPAAFVRLVCRFTAGVEFTGKDVAKREGSNERPGLNLGDPKDVLVSWRPGCWFWQAFFQPFGKGAVLCWLRFSLPPVAITLSQVGSGCYLLRTKSCSFSPATSHLQ